MSRAALLACAVLLAACSGEPKEEVSDSGATQVARAVVAADRRCEVAGFEDLQSCIDSQDQELRRGAETALTMTEAYTRLCAPDLGRQRCDEMLEMAYMSARK